MRRRPGGMQAVSPEAGIQEAARALLAGQVSSLVVRDGGRIVGVFTKNDLTRCCAEGSCGRAKVAEYMHPEVYTATPEGDLDELVRTMVERGFHHVPVTEDGIVVTTTGLHLARRIGNAVERRFHGDARITYLPESNLIQVDWE